MLISSGSWRLINTGECSAAYNMALDEAIAVSVRNGMAPPTLRLYAWDSPSVSLGHFQKNRDVNIEYCLDSGIPIVRRPTGGRAILHDRELTYSFSVKTDNELFSKGIFDSYKKISSALQLALLKIGISPEVRTDKKTLNAARRTPLCFQATSYGEITVNNRKVIGSAQKHWADGLLQQGSIPYHIDKSEIQKVFVLQTDQDITEVMAGLNDMLPDLKDEDFRDIIKDSFEETFDISFTLAFPTPEEESLALVLENEKYQKSDWTIRQ
ncbi:MAG: lipoate--protein ligase family protein [Nitrospirae bacterium]|nr:lipoate--protein ligase family protein [Nitrospirota bacterium]